MKTLTITKGLPGSGKTTWAKEEQKKDPNLVRVNKDELRSMLHNSVHSKGREDFVLMTRNFITSEALASGHNVIIDDTNFNKHHEQILREIAKQHKANFKVMAFTDVPIEECIKRDLKRQNSVGERVIRQMYNQYLKPKPEPTPEINFDLPFAVICDLDGTLALFGDKNPYDRDFLQDELNPAVAHVIWKLGEYIHLIIVSGRNDKFRDSTKEWLKKNSITYSALHMRKDGDDRKDSIVKTEIYENEIKGKYNINYVLDDRDQVVEMWRSKGLPCLQVAPGDF